MKYLIITALLLLSGCASFGGIFGGDDGDQSTPLPTERTIGAQQSAPLVGKEFKNVNGKTARYISKQQLFQMGCNNQSDAHNSQRLTVSLAPPVVLAPNAITGTLEAVQLPDNYQTKVYNQGVAPFDMTGCLAQASSSGWERIASKMVGELFGLAKTAVPYAAGVAIADRALSALATSSENAQPQITGDNNRVVTGDSNTYTEAGGIATEPLTFSEASIGTLSPESDDIDFVCVDERPTLPGEEAVDVNGDGLVCSDGNGNETDNL